MSTCDCTSLCNTSSHSGKGRLATGCSSRWGVHPCNLFIRRACNRPTVLTQVGTHSCIRSQSLIVFSNGWHTLGHQPQAIIEVVLAVVQHSMPESVELSCLGPDACPFSCLHVSQICNQTVWTLEDGHPPIQYILPVAVRLPDSLCIMDPASGRFCWTETAVFGPSVVLRMASDKLIQVDHQCVGRLTHTSQR